jgi:hypothetical protein
MVHQDLHAWSMMQVQLLLGEGHATAFNSLSSERFLAHG